MLKLISLLCVIGAAFTYPNHDPKTSRHSEQPVITTPLGQIQGTILASRLGKQIYSFRGIRYAKAPIGDLRFQPPVPAEKFEGIYNATHDPPLCPQPTDETTSEDCLFLNVYTTKYQKDNNNPKRPVIVFIHGGGFHSLGSSSNWLGPQYLLDQEIVLVTFNYRLGILGFFSTGDKESPGNYGLKDQVLVLKWIQNNIAAFGGDAGSVTIVGHGAGGISATLHMVSPLSRGLFHRVVAMSGAATTQLSYCSCNKLEVSKKQAKILGCPDDSTANIMKCLKGKTADELGDSVSKFLEFGDDPLIIWNPVIEVDVGIERFLTEHPITLIQKNEFAKVPVVLGVTTEEFAARAFQTASNETLRKQFNEKFETVAPIAFLYERDTDKSKSISSSLRKIYLNDKPIDENKVSGLVHLYADALSGFAVHRAAELLAQKSNASVYYYRFNYNGRYSHFYMPNSDSQVPFGVVHNDDLIYLFYIQKVFPLFQDVDSETQTVNKFTLLLANFARTGNPTPETSDKLDNVKWDLFEIKTEKYLDIGNKLVINEKLNEERYAEWEKLFPLSDYK